MTYTGVNQLDNNHTYTQQTGLQIAQHKTHTIYTHALQIKHIIMQHITMYTTHDIVRHNYTSPYTYNYTNQITYILQKNHYYYYCYFGLIFACDVC